MQIKENKFPFLCKLYCHKIDAKYIPSKDVTREKGLDNCHIGSVTKNFH